MIPRVITTTVIRIVVTQIIARVGSLRLFLIGGTGVMRLGVFLLTTLNTGSSLWLVAAYLFVMELGMGTVMPVATLAVQAAVESRLLGVATSTTQFIRSIGSTMGTAVMGTLVASGYGVGVARALDGGMPKVPRSVHAAYHGMPLADSQGPLLVLADVGPFPRHRYLAFGVPASPIQCWWTTELAGGSVQIGAEDVIWIDEPK